MVYITTPDKNFGDSLNAPVLGALFGIENVVSCFDAPPIGRRLSAIGSIAHLMIGNVAIWGSGALTPKDVSKDVTGMVFASRGELSKKAFVEAGYELVSETMCDPGVLACYFWREICPISDSGGIVYIPHKNDSPSRTGRICKMIGASLMLHPVFTSMDIIMHEIARAKLVVSSSLHGVIIAEGFGKHAIALKGEFEHPFKYFDYFSGTGRLGCGLNEEKDIFGDINKLILPPAKFDIGGLLTHIPEELSLQSSVCVDDILNYYKRIGVLK